MEGYTTNNMFQSQDSTFENIEQKNEVEVKEYNKHDEQQQIPTQHIEEQEQEHPENEHEYDHQSNLVNQEEEIKEIEDKSYIKSIWNKICNLDNIVLFVLVILIAILYKLYI